MFEPIYISVHTLQHSIQHCLGALEAFESSSEFYLHPDGGLIVFRKDSRLYIMSHEERLATMVAFKKFDLRVVDDLLFLIAMARCIDLPRPSSLKAEAADGDS